MTTEASHHTTCCISGARPGARPQGRLLRRCGALLVLLVAGVLGLLWWLAGVVLQPPWYEHRRPEQGLRPYEDRSWMALQWQGIHHDPRTDLGLPFEDVSFPTEGGQTLRGWYVPGRPGARAGVVAVHGMGADRREFLRHVPLLHQAGYPVLLFDLREHGVSDGRGRGHGGGTRESRDVSAAVRHARTAHGLRRVAVLGTSLGGSSVILAAAADPAIDAVIAENPFTSVADVVRDSSAEVSAPPWLVRLIPRGQGLARIIAGAALWRAGGAAALTQPAPIEVVDRLAPRPLLLMHGTADTTIPPAHSERLYARAGQPKRLWLAPGADHAALFNRHPEEFRARVLDFLRAYLPQQE